MREPLVYGLDIETDTSVDGLDPAVAGVVTVALATPLGDEVFCGPEVDILADVDARLAELPPGVVATWNGSAFDLPFLADRSSACGVMLGLRLRHDPSITLRHQPLPGHPGAYRARWYDHGHLDAYRLYRGDVGPALRVSCSLKSIARLVGLAPVEVDRTRIHDLTREALHAYAASDARLARVLAERRWPAAARFVDRFVDRVTERASRRLALERPAVA
jgi:hypothetical protein